MPHTATLKPKEDRRLLRGHRWAYRNEFAALPNAEDGDLVDVLADGGRFLGRGFFQTTGGIAVRLLTLEDGLPLGPRGKRRPARIRSGPL